MSTIKANAILDAAGGNTATINGIVPSKPFLGSVVNISTNTTLTTAQNLNMLAVSATCIITLPAVATGLAFGVANNSASSVYLKSAVSGTLIDGIGSSATIEAGKSCLVICDGSKWSLVGDSATPSIRIRNFSSGTSYVPSADCVAFLAMLTGATGAISNNTSTKRAGTGGGGYSEKFYSGTLAGSYAYTLGAAGVTAAIGGNGGTSTFDVMTVTGSNGTSGATGSSGGVGSGGTFNATGGTGGAAISGQQGGGGGGAGSRAGNGGDGGAASTSGADQLSGGGGGTGGNNASLTVGGIAATSTSASAYSLSALFSSFSFRAGGAGLIYPSSGGYGATSQVTGFYGYPTNQITFAGGGAGTGGYAYFLGAGFDGSAGYLSIMEFLI